MFLTFSLGQLFHVILFVSSFFMQLETKSNVNQSTLSENNRVFENNGTRESQQIDSFIAGLHNSGLFNGTVLVARKGNIIYHRSLGIATIDKKDSLTNSMPYQLASVSKPITAAAIMLLVQRGEFDLDHPITRYFPELILLNKVTIRHLLTHTSGLPDYINRMPAWWKHDYYPNNNDFLSFLVKTNTRPAFAPGFRFNYSNTNYALLASLIERITDQTFADFVREEIFDPLGMCNSFVFAPDNVANQSIKGYRASGRNWVEYGVDYRNGIVGDKGIFSTADDLLRFTRAFDADYWWCNETCQAMFQGTPVQLGGVSEYGLGWRMRTWDSMQVVLHYGFWNSFRTGLIEFPESGVTFVILNNFTGPNGGKINNRELIIKELMKIVFPKNAISRPQEFLIQEQDPKGGQIDLGEGESN